MKSIETTILTFKKRINFCLFLMIGLFLTGCSVPKEVAYFQDINQDTITLPSSGELKIRPNDKLSIVVKTMDPELSAIFNLGINADQTRQTTAAPSGLSLYTVDSQGYIDVPVLGLIKAEGMTRSELAAFIKGDLVGKNLAKDPVVTVEFQNPQISVLGEVKQPGMVDIPRDKITILEAIAEAGDLDLQGRRDNVAVIRETDGVVTTYRVDLTNYKELTSSPAYYLQQGDIVYVEPNDMKKRQTTTNGNNVYSTGFWISVASLLTSVVTTVGVFVVK